MATQSPNDRLRPELLLLGLVMAASGVAGAMMMKCATHHDSLQSGMGHIETSRDTTTTTDTVSHLLPEPTGETRVATMTVRLPISHKAGAGPLPGPQAGDGGHAVPGPQAGDHLQRDSAEVELPVTQREYEGEGYRAWVSGFEPRLDSIHIFARHDVVTVRQTVAVGAKQKRWGIGIFAGYGMTPDGLRPCAGVSINYNIISF